MKVQKRLCNVKGHTIGYKISGKWKTRKEAYELARDGKLDHVVACRGEYGGYIQSLPSAPMRLYDLEEMVEA
jgi:hypothetical protein